MSKIVSGIGKAVGGIVKGVTKAFKSVVKAVTKSTLGKALLIGAAIYFGGAALGMWNSPIQAINGALVSNTAPAAAAAAEGGMASGLVAGGDVAASTVAGAGTSGAAAGGAATTAAGELAGVKAAGAAVGAGSGAAPVLSGAASGAGSAGASKGIIDSVLAFANKHPVLTYGALTVGGAALKGAFSPDAMDVLDHKRQLEQEDLARQNQNLNVQGVNLGIAPAQPGILRDAYGNPVFSQNTGIINQVMRRV